MKQKFSLIVLLLLLLTGSSAQCSNRFAYLDETDPFYPDTHFPKLITPQWVGQEHVDAVITLGIDDMSNNAQKYEDYLRPIIKRLKELHGRAPVSIMSCRIDPQEPILQTWLQEGLSLEIHTLTHPCPILAKNDFQAADQTFHGCVDLFHKIPGNKPVAFRTPCCDSLNTPSPRLYKEIFSKTSSDGHYLSLDSSVFTLTSSKDPEVPKELVLQPDGQERFLKYVPFPSYVVTVENYPYPYLINQLIWEMPCMVPSDWEAQHLHRPNNPLTVEDWKRALDITVIKKGTFNLVFHPHGWITSQQIVEFINYAHEKYGNRVLILNFREVQERLDRNLLKGQAARSPAGVPNGVRLLDLNDDKLMDVIIANSEVQVTRLWDPRNQKWTETPFPKNLVRQPGLFGILHTNIPLFVSAESAWEFRNGHWLERSNLMKGLDAVRHHLRPASARFLDADNNGNCELLVSFTNKTSLFQWSEARSQWEPSSLVFPKSVSLVNPESQDNGLRFVDLNQDGYRDIILSNEEEFGAWLFVPQEFLRFPLGWSRELLRGKRGEKPEIPMIVRGGAQRDNGAWFKKRTLWVQNEDTAHLPDLVERLSFDDLLNGLQPPAKKPEESLQTIQVDPRFKVELVAYEPLVQDPVALEFAPDGKLWVAEMRDYPNGSTAGGAVRFLEDLDRDGFYEQSTIFLEGLKFPTGVMPFRKGVLISAAPDIIYAEDSDGDGKADVREVLYTGFGEWNQQHRVNGFEWGLDNWIYVANGDSQGRIRQPGQNKVIDISGRDFRFHPLTAEFEAAAGQTQFGRRRDDWGNWFGNANYTWGWHYFLPEHYLTRNPHLAVRSNKRNFSDDPESGRVFPLGRLQPRFNDIHTSGFVTSACSITPYRDSLFGEDFENSLFISEPAQALIHRVSLLPNGVSFRTVKPAEEAGREFLASADTWFRPCGTRIGPDGALYITDMYRQFIEHPEWIPQDIQDRFDLRAGEQMGRIYRVSLKDQPLRSFQALHSLDGKSLAQHMESPNGWQRDTVQRLLVEKQDSSAAPVLVSLVQQSSRPQVRLQALCTLEGLQALSPPILQLALRDQHPAIREHAVRLCEPFLRNTHSHEMPPLLKSALLERVNDSQLRVRYQLAFTLGEWASEEAANYLALLANKDPGSAELKTAILSSARRFPHTLLGQLMAAGTPDEHLVQHLVELITKKAEPAARDQMVGFFLDNFSNEPWQLRALSILVQMLGKSIPSASLNQWKPVVASAETVLEDPNLSTETRLAAISLLGRFPSEEERHLHFLASLLRPSTPLPISRAAISRLLEISPDKAAPLIWKAWTSATPELRSAMVERFTQNSVTSHFLVQRITAGELALSEVSPTLRNQLLNHADPGIVRRAQELFKAASNTAKAEMVRQYHQKIQGSSRNESRGKELFEQHCAVCHRVGELGTGSGPNLAMLQDDSDEVLIAGILDPNRAVEDKYRNYTLTKISGEEFSGIILNESGNSITLMTASGEEQTLLRNEIQSIQISTLSLMPEGFEEVLNPEEIADLIAFIRARGSGK